jgi:hypothetical protein
MPLFGKMESESIDFYSKDELRGQNSSQMRGGAVHFKARGEPKQGEKKRTPFRFRE